MDTATFDDAEALPVQPDMVTGDSTVELSLMLTSVLLVCGAQVGPPPAPAVSVQVLM